ncbi:hypothetical protein HU200_011419 [Digitaria exilis]|uniref:Uncharacterized protein n=1 Tax=Digitaria exilis TaxID=1010633 RepID=A0A835FHY9_9POAL|nr:hypothetical protein HU200_011419 [Digitaria exilis]
MGASFNALICVLKHTPFLEISFFNIFQRGPKHEVEMNGRYISVRKSAEIPEHLEIVEVKCKAVNWNVVKVLKFFGTFGICKITSDTSHIFLYTEFCYGTH